MVLWWCEDKQQLVINRTQFILYLKQPSASNHPINMSFKTAWVCGHYNSNMDYNDNWHCFFWFKKTFELFDLNWKYVNYSRFEFKLPRKNIHKRKVNVLYLCKWYRFAIFFYVFIFNMLRLKTLSWSKMTIEKCKCWLLYLIKFQYHIMYLFNF